MILLGAIPLETAYAALDMNTLVLLFGMMILNTNLRMAGFFRLVGGRGYISLSAYICVLEFR